VLRRIFGLKRDKIMEVQTKQHKEELYNLYYLPTAIKTIKSRWMRRARHIRRGADKSLAFPISYFPICSTTKRIFPGWVKEVKTIES
jgi:hypothetical protein